MSEPWKEGRVACIGEDAQHSRRQPQLTWSESCGLGHLRPWAKDKVPFLLPVWWWPPIHGSHSIVYGVLAEARRQDQSTRDLHCGSMLIPWLEIKLNKL